MTIMPSSLRVLREFKSTSEGRLEPPGWVCKNLMPDNLFVPLLLSINGRETDLSSPITMASTLFLLLIYIPISLPVSPVM